MKSRRRLPYVVTRALAQAEGYRPGAVPLAVVFEYGRAGGLAIVRLADFARIAGLDVRALPAPTPLPRPPVQHSAQLTLPGVA